MSNKETIIRPSSSFVAFNLSELYDYRDLLWLIIRRDFVSRYKQTVLGPAWAIIQPVSTSLVFTVVFSKVGKMPTDDVPPFLFYLAGMIFWQLFAGSLQSAGNSLQANAQLFSKVYFPRIIPVLGSLLSQLIPFIIQLAIFSCFCLSYYIGSEGADFHWARLLWFPVLLVQVMLFSLATCLICSALTAKYRDLQHALGFIVQLGLYLTPVIYSASSISESKRWLIWLNPMAAPVSASKWMLLDAGSFPTVPLLLSAIFTTIACVLSVIYFQRVQRTFVDSV